MSVAAVYENWIDQETGEHMLSVLFAISEGGEVVQRMRHGFPLGITVETLEGEATKALNTYVSDVENGIRNAEFEAQNGQADDTIAAMVGREITQ